jgi:hypothetical protein
MNNEYVDLLEQYINEHILSTTSEIYSKFVGLVQNVFVKRAEKGEKILSASKKPKLPSQEDLMLFKKYRLLVKEKDTILLTKKGLMYATGKSVYSNKDPDDKDFAEHLKYIESVLNGEHEAKQYPISWYELTYKAFTTGGHLNSHEEEWKERRRIRKLKDKIIAKGKR